MRQVAKDQFYAAIGGMNVHPQIQPGPYPYTSVWKTLTDRRVVGKSVGRLSGALAVNDYFLPDRQT